MEKKKRCEFKSVFDERVKELSVASNSALLVAEKYAEHIAYIECIKAGATKGGNDYRMLRTYDVPIGRRHQEANLPRFFLICHLCYVLRDGG